MSGNSRMSLQSKQQLFWRAWSCAECSRCVSKRTGCIKISHKTSHLRSRKNSQQWDMDIDCPVAEKFGRRIDSTAVETFRMIMSQIFFQLYRVFYNIISYIIYHNATFIYSYWFPIYGNRIFTNIVDWKVWERSQCFSISTQMLRCSKSVSLFVKK